MRFKINTNGIRFQLFMLGSLPTMLLVALLTYYFIGHQFHFLEQSLQERGKTIAKQLAVASIYGVFSGNKLMLQDLANDLLNEKDIIFVSIYNNQNKPLAQAGNISLAEKANLRIFDAQVKIQLLQQSSQEIDLNAFEFAENDGEKIIGSIKIGLGLQHIRKAEQLFLRNSLVIIAICFALAIMLASRLGRAISSPIINLTQVADDLANGDMDSRANATNTTEIATLCDSFNAMAIGLQQTQNYLQQQVDNAIKELTIAMQTLEEKNRSLEKTTQLAILQNETKSQFLAHISHEIRTPMNGIIGFIDLLTQSDLTPKQLEQALLIKTSASNLLTIVNEILDYSSLETGNFKTENITFNIRECLENTIATIIPRSIKVQIIVDINPKTPTLLISDPVRIRQVLTNLVGNACKYTKQGHIIIRCTLTKKSRLFISVSDTGFGIAKEILKDLFHPFLQISEYAVDNELGTGLGLTISKNITERLGGRIGASSRLGDGSTFWFDIPVALAPEPTRTLPDMLVTVIGPVSYRRKALLRQLSYLGYATRCFSAIDQFLHQTAMREIILYAANSSIQSDDDFIAEQARIKTFIGNTNVIFIIHQLLNPNTPNTLVLPCRSAFLQQLIESTEKESPSIPNHSLQNVRQHFPIFIADDNEINRLLLKSQLENRFDNITLAEDGKRAWSLLQLNKYQLILLDLQMPYYNGLELLEKIKQPDSINRNTPLIAITAHAQSHQRKKLIDAGFDECLIKPIMLEQLDEVLNVWQPLENNKEKNSLTNETMYIEQMLEKTSQNTQLAHILFNKLFIELPTQLHEIAHALENQDWELAREVTHKLHGSVGFCGFVELKSSASQLETQLSTQQSDAIESFAVLRRQIEHFIGLKQTILQNLPRYYST